MRPDVARWLARACADAEARGLPELRPLLEGLARSTSTLRDADPELTGAAADPDHARNPSE
jgi:hypothetical protein